MTVSPELAAAAWEYATRDHDPMPPAVVVDWLRERCETDNVNAVKQALYIAAADWLEGRKPWAWADTPVSGLSLLLRGEQFDRVRDVIDRSRAAWRHEPRLTAYYDSAEFALDLCRQIEAA